MSDRGFRSCTSADDVIDRLSSQMHVYKISPIQQLIAKLPNDELCRVVDLYEEEGSCFLSGTRIVTLSTSQMPGLPEDMCEVQFVFTKQMARERTLEEIGILARKSFGKSYTISCLR